MNYNLSRESDFIKIAAGDSFVRYVSAKEFLGMIVTSAGKISFRCPTFVKENVAMSDVVIEGNPYTNDADFISLLEQLGSNDGGMFSNTFIKKLVEYESGSKVISIQPVNILFNSDNENSITAEDLFTYYYGKLNISADGEIGFFVGNNVGDISAGNYLITNAANEADAILFQELVYNGDPLEGAEQTAVFIGYKIKVQTYVSLDFTQTDDDAIFSANFQLSEEANIVVDWGDGTFDNYSADEDNNIAITHNYKENGFVFTIKILGSDLSKIQFIGAAGDIQTNGRITAMNLSSLINLTEVALQFNEIPNKDVLKLFADLNTIGLSDGDVEIAGQEQGNMATPDSVDNLRGNGWTINFDEDM